MTEVTQEQDGDKEGPDEHNADAEFADKDDNPETTCKSNSIP